MERSATDANARAAPPKPQPYFIVMGSIPATDEDFLEWKKDHCLGRNVRDAMVMYVEHLNSKGKVIYDRQEEVYEAYIQSLKQAKQQTKSKAKDKAQDQALILTLEDKPQNACTLQIIPVPQNIPSNSTLPDQSPPQNIVSSLPEHLPPQNIVPSLPEHLPPQNIPSPQIGQQAGPTRTD